MASEMPTKWMDAGACPPPAAGGCAGDIGYTPQRAKRTPDRSPPVSIAVSGSGESHLSRNFSPTAKIATSAAGQKRLSAGLRHSPSNSAMLVSAGHDSHTRNAHQSRGHDLRRVRVARSAGHLVDARSNRRRSESGHGNSRRSSARPDDLRRRG